MSRSDGLSIASRHWSSPLETTFGAPLMGASLPSDPHPDPYIIDFLAVLQAVYGGSVVCGCGMVVDHGGVDAAVAQELLDHFRIVLSD